MQKGDTMASDRRPVIKGPDGAWKRLGELLQLRRAELGYRRRPAFTRDRGINIRLVTDIENAYRPNTFLTPTLREIAQAYQVTYDSLIAVLLQHDDELTPAPQSPLPYLGDAPIADRASREADAPYAMQIMEQILDYASRGIRNPTGTQLFPGSPEDAQIWDGIGGRLDIRDRVWLIADLRRRAAARGAHSGTGTEAP
jgi:hypothetical protein